METVYVRIHWQNQPSTATALGATNLNKIDLALSIIDGRVVGLATTKLDMDTANGMVQDVTLNESGVFTIKKLDGSTTTYDTKLEKLAVNFEYDPIEQQLVITLDDGTKQYVDMSSLITEYEFDDSSTIAFNVAQGKVSASVKNGSITADKLQPDYLADVTVQAQNAYNAAAQSIEYADLSKRYAVGGIVTEDEFDNAKYYMEQARIARDQAEDISNVGIATEVNLGLVKGGGNVEIDESGNMNVNLSGKLDKTGDAKDTTITFPDATVDAPLTSGLSMAVLWGRVKKKFADILAEMAQRLYHLDGYNDFFGGSANNFVTGQRTISTNTSAEITIGETVLPLDSVDGITPGVVLLIKAGSSMQQMLSVQSVSGNNVTVYPALTNTLEVGSSVTPLWVNSSHLTTNGLIAWTYWFINSKDEQGNYIIPRTGSPKITLLGDSWFSQDKNTMQTIILASIPSAVVVNAGVSGSTSSQLLDRFDSDVPIDSDFVIFNEPGVNDVYQSLDTDTVMQNLDALVNKIHNIQAVPVFTGVPPLSDYAGYAKIMAQQFNKLIGTGIEYPLLPITGIRPIIEPEIYSISVGNGALNHVTTGKENTAFGKSALGVLKTGISNVGIGRSSGANLVSGSNNTAIGARAFELGTGHHNTAIGTNALYSNTLDGNTGIGSQAGFLATSAQDNVLIGKRAAYLSNGSTSGATTTGDYQVVIGSEALGAPTSHYCISVGYRAKASGAYAIAIGANTKAEYNGSVAIGEDSTGVSAQASAADEFLLGTINHTVKVPGKLNIARVTPSSSSDTRGQVGDITTDNNYIYVKTSAGWKRSALSTW